MDFGTAGQGACTGTCLGGSWGEDKNLNGIRDQNTDGDWTETNFLASDSDVDGIMDGWEQWGRWCYKTETAGQCDTLSDRHRFAEGFLQAARLDALMATRAPRPLSPDQRALIEEAIADGDFRDLEDFEDYALRQAVAQLRLRKLQANARKHPHSAEEILREAKSVRRAVAKKYEA